MKFFFLGLAVYACSSVTGAQAQTQNPLVNLTGNLNPVYSVTVSESDLQQIAQGIDGIQTMQSIQVDVNSIYSEKDVTAFTEASQEVSRVVLEAAKTLVDMRAIIYKLDIASQRDTQHRHTAQIYQSYQNHLQSRFTTLIELFVGKDGKYNEALTTAMEKCFTEACMQDISDAQTDMVNFGRSINNRIDLDSTTVWENRHQVFNSKIVKNAIQMTWDKVLRTNQKESLYVKMLRAASAPFAAAASGTVASAEVLGTFITPRTKTRYKVYANPIKRSKMEWTAVENQFDTRFGESFQLIIAKQQGAKQYSEVISNQGESESSSVSTAAGTDFASLAPSLKTKFVELQGNIDNLDKLQATDPSTVKSMLRSILSNTSDRAVYEWIFQDRKAQFSTAKAAGLVPQWTKGTFGVWPNMPSKPNYSENYKTMIYTDGRFIAAFSGSSSYSIEGTIYQVENVSIGFLAAGDQLFWAIPFYSQSSQQLFFYWVELNLNDLITTTNGKLKINLNPKAPKSTFFMSPKTR